MRPRQFSLYSKATYSCVHRYTSRPICSVPCDDVDDMCAELADEDSCNIPSFTQLLIHAAIFSVLSGVVIVGGKYLRKTFYEKKSIGIEEIIEEVGKIQITSNQDLRHMDTLGMAVQDFMIYISHTKHVVVQRKLCCEIFATEARLQKKELSAHMFIFQQMGTNDSIGRFYDLLNLSITVEIELFFTKWLSQIIKVLTSSYVIMARHILTSFIRIAIFYTDIYKDIYLALIIYRQMISQPNGLAFAGDGSLPTIIFISIYI